jgi:Zn-dependent protease
MGFVVLLLVHEMGHVIELRRQGIRASAPMFIPFLGAVVAMKQLPQDAAAEARVGLAGPVLGSIGAAACWAIGAGIDSDFWRALAFVGFFLNLFNLAPVTPLDGGRAVAALSPWMWFLGLFLVAVLAFTYPSPIIILILIMGVLDVSRRWKARHTQGDYYKVAPRHRAAVAVVYLGLIVALSVAMDLTHLVRHIP